MRYTEREKTVIIIAGILSVACPMAYTIFHLLDFSDISHSNAHYLVLYRPAIIATTFTYFVCLLTLIFYTIKGILTGYRRHQKNSTYFIVLLILTLLILIYNPILLFYFLKYVSFFSTLKTLWIIIHFLGAIIPIVLILKIISEKKH
ncbi:MAG TPA: hypothetical protein QF753_20510 [Victivallales bacterium]|nr:hypothetical protein [Victivallales bacterium]